MEQSTVNIEIMTTLDVQKPPELSEHKNFYIVYSPKKFKLRSHNSVMLDSQIKINLPDGIEASIGLLPTFVARNLTMEIFRRLSNKTKDNFLQLDILNRDFYNTVSMKKNQEFVYIVLLNEKSSDNVLTTYNILNY